MRISPSQIINTSNKPQFQNFVPEMIDTMRVAVERRIDMEMLDLKFAWVISDFYKKGKNIEKAYYILKKAFSDNKSSVEIFSNNYISVFKIRPLMCHLLGPENDKKWEEVVSERRSLKNWLVMYKTEHVRQPLIKHYLERLEKILRFKELIKLVQNLGDLASMLSQYNSALYYYEI